MPAKQNKGLEALSFNVSRLFFAVRLRLFSSSSRPPRYYCFIPVYASGIAPGIMNKQALLSVRSDIVMAVKILYQNVRRV